MINKLKVYRLRLMKELGANTYDARFIVDLALVFTIFAIRAPLCIPYMLFLTQINPEDD